MHIANQSGSLLEESLFTFRIAAEEASEFLRIGHLVHANVDHRGAGLHEITCDHSGPSDCGDQNVGPSAYGRQIVCFRMTHGHGGIGVDEQHGRRLAYDVTAPDNDGFLAGNGYLASFQDFDNSGRRARNEAGALRGKVADIDRMKAGDILGWIDGQEDSFRIDLPGQRQLHQDAVDFVASIQVVNKRKQLLSARGLSRRVLLAIDPDLFGGLYFAANIDFRSGIVADQHYREARANTRRFHGLHVRSNLIADIVGDLCSVKNSGGHLSSVVRRAYSATKSYTAEPIACAGAASGIGSVRATARR